MDDAPRQDYMINFWLDAMLGPMNPEYQDWIDQHILTQISGAEADITPDYGYMVFYSQTGKPDEFDALALKILKEKKPVSQEVYEALRIMYRANSLRAFDNFESLAPDHVRGTFQNFEPLGLSEKMAAISCYEINEYIQSLDFSHRTSVRINGFETQDEESKPGDLLENTSEIQSE